ncbi:hypothetical protein OFN51_35810, partial [Escherichia coli]|nr:hypothetical protein [Escherichia coli]
KFILGAFWPKQICMFSIPNPKPAILKQNSILYFSGFSPPGQSTLIGCKVMKVTEINKITSKIFSPSVYKINTY